MGDDRVQIRDIKSNKVKGTLIVRGQALKYKGEDGGDYYTVEDPEIDLRFKQIKATFLRQREGKKVKITLISNLTNERRKKLNRQPMSNL
ncbi:MAG: hypothetical protein IPN90_13490 [Elusimicrobia bacterium]|nr:hypothetical protein [Elusimicrobiota bacterium]